MYLLYTDITLIYKKFIVLGICLGLSTLILIRIHVTHSATPALVASTQSPVHKTILISTSSPEVADAVPSNEQKVGSTPTKKKVPTQGTEKKKKTEK